MYELVCPLRREENMPDGQELLWPVLIFQIDVCIREGNLNLNLFEHVLLQLINLSGQVSEIELAEETCLPQEAVYFWVNSLQRKGYLDEQYRPVKKKTASGFEGKHTIICAFYDLLTGEFLPELVEEAKLERYRFEDKGQWACYKVGKNQGSGSERQAFWLLPPEQARTRKLQPAEILGLMDSHRRQWAPGGHYETAVQGSLAFLRTYLCRNVSSGNYLLKNPLGSGYSPQLYAGLLAQEKSSPQNWQRIQEVRKQLENITEVEEPTDVVDSKKADKLGKQIQVEEFSQELHRFPLLRGKLIAIQAAEQGLQRNSIVDTRTSQTWRKNAAELCKAVYDGLEETLHIIGNRYDLYSWSRRLLTLTYAGRQEYLLVALRHLGLYRRNNKQGSVFLKCSNKAFTSYFQEDIFSLPVMFVLNLVAAEKNPAHPFWNLSKFDKDILEHWAILKEERDAVVHGADGKWDNDYLLHSAAKFKSFVQIMLPELKLEQNTLLVDDKKTNQSMQNRWLKANTKLRDALGLNFFSSVDGQRLERLQRTQCLLDALQEPDEFFQDKALHVIMECAGILQQGFEEALVVSKAIREINGNEIKELAEQILHKAGCLAEEEHLSPALATVSEGFISKAQKKKEATLGADYLSWLGNGGIQVTDLHKQRPIQCKELYCCVCTLLVHRRHGNRVVEPVSKCEIEIMWQGVLQSLLLLWENGFWLVNELG